VRAIDASGVKTVIRCANGDAHECDAAILTVPLPVLEDIALPPGERERAAAASHIGFGNVIKILMCFRTRWWLERCGDLADLTFLLSEASVPVWWTQQPADLPVLTGWFGGPKTAGMANFDEQGLIKSGLTSLAEIFGRDQKELKRNLIAARAINWALDPFARGAYSYATTETRAAQTVLSKPADRSIFFSGEALYRGKDMGTVEAALANGLETARMIIRG
jgi:monoamine oxidase